MYDAIRVVAPNRAGSALDSSVDQLSGGGTHFLAVETTAARVKQVASLKRMFNRSKR